VFIQTLPFRHAVDAPELVAVLLHQGGDEVLNYVEEKFSVVHISHPASLHYFLEEPLERFLGSVTVVEFKVLEDVFGQFEV